MLYPRLGVSHWEAKIREGHSWIWQPCHVSCMLLTHIKGNQSIFSIVDFESCRLAKCFK
jgi:hypothetical protein